VLEDANLVLMHEWNEPALIARIGRYFRQHRSGRVLFHDTHHRSVTARDEMRRYDLSGYDGVLAFGAAVRERYLSEGWARHVWVWHEAADVRVFFPRRADRIAAQLAHFPRQGALRMMKRAGVRYAVVDEAWLERQHVEPVDLLRLRHVFASARSQYGVYALE